MEKSLDKKFYFNDEIFKQELDNIFHSDWICCGREEDIDSLAVIKSLKLAMRIFSSSKTKIMTLEFFIIFVSTEVVKFLGMKNQALKRNIRCPYHSWVYNFDGSLYKAPHLDVDITDKRFHLNKVKSETWGGFIYKSR